MPVKHCFNYCTHILLDLLQLWIITADFFLYNPCTSFSSFTDLYSTLFSCLTQLISTSSTVLNRSCDDGTLILFLISKGNFSTFHHCLKWVAFFFFFLNKPYSRVSNSPSNPNLLRVFIINGFLVLSNIFSPAYVEMIICFSPLFC